MKIETLVVGILETNCYLLSINDNYLIIDPGAYSKKIIDSIKGNVLGIIITHYHPDHYGALENLTDYYKCPTYDINNLKEGINQIGDFEFEMIKTPGHKEDLIILLFKNKLFCGDFIFKGTIGRMDLPGGSITDMQESIKKIIKYNPNIIIYPGHGEITALKEEIPNLKRYL